MAPLEETIITVAGSVFPTNRLFYIEPDANINTDVVYCVFSLVGGDDPGTTLRAWSAYSTARVQFTILSTNALDLPDKAKALRDALEAANTARTLKCMPLGPGFDLPGDDTRLMGRVVEYQITSYDPLA